MADEISLETLVQHRAAAQPEAIPAESAETLQAQTEVLTPEQRKRVEELKDSINLMDSQTTIQYGVGVQRNISSFADQILNQVRSKDSGYVGELMTELALEVKEVGVDELGEESFLDKIPFLRDASRALKKFTQKYEKLEVQIDSIQGELDKVRMQMLKDITMYDGFYEKNLEYFRELQVYITAGEEKMRSCGRSPFPGCGRRQLPRGIL